MYPPHCFFLLFNPLVAPVWWQTNVEMKSGKSKEVERCPGRHFDWSRAQVATRGGKPIQLYKNMYLSPPRGFAH